MHHVGLDLDFDLLLERLSHVKLEIEPDLGVLLPCNVVARRDDEGTVVAAMEPLAATGLAQNRDLAPLAAAVSVPIAECPQRQSA